MSGEPDFGEPLTVDKRNPLQVRMRPGDNPTLTGAEQVARAVACMNACAGMADPAAEIATLRARVAELEDALETERSNTAFEQEGLRAMRLNRDNFRRQLAASEASRARLVAYIRADDDLEYALLCGDRDEIAAKREVATRARRMIKSAQDLAPETPHG